MNKKYEIKKIKKRLKDLSKLINEHNIHYHQNVKHIISDGEFDKLVIENSNLEKKFPDLIIKNGPNKTVGSKLKNKFKKSLHKSPMLSLGNAFNFDELKEFDERIKKYLSIKIEKNLSIFVKLKLMAYP